MSNENASRLIPLISASRIAGDARLRGDLIRKATNYELDEFAQELVEDLLGFLDLALGELAEVMAQVPGGNRVGGLPQEVDDVVQRYAVMLETLSVPQPKANG